MVFFGFVALNPFSGEEQALIEVSVTVSVSSVLRISKQISCVSH